MLAPSYIASRHAARGERGMAGDAARVLDILTLLKQGDAEQARAWLDELGRSANLLKITALLCADAATKSDLGLRRARRRLLSAMGEGRSAVGWQPGAAASGLAPLTRRQIAVLCCVREGATNAEAAGRLGISLNTIKWHLKTLTGVLGAKNRCDLVQRAQTRGLI